MQPYPRSPDLVWPGHLHGTGCLSARSMDTGFPTVAWRLCLGLRCGSVRLSAAPPHSWRGGWGVCALVCALRLYPATPCWGVRCGCVWLGSGSGCAPPLLGGVLGFVSACVRAPLAPRHSWLGCAAWVYVLRLGFWLRPATPGWGVGVCVCSCARSPCPRPHLARVRGVGVCVWARVWAAPRHSWLGCALWVCVLGPRFWVRPATPGWAVGLCVCSCARSACTPPLLAGVRDVGVCVWARVSAAPRHSWLGCWAVCVLVCALRLHQATPGTGARCGCVCLDSGFGCPPPLLAGLLRCMCACVCAPLVPCHSWLGFAVWVCVFGLRFWLRPAIPGWGVGICVCLCARSACTPPLLAGVCSVGVCASARVSAAPRHSWLGCWGVCVLLCALRLPPATPGTGARCGRVCLGSAFGCAPPLLAGVCVVGVCARARVLGAPRHSWLGCWAVCLLVCALCLHPTTPGWGAPCGCVCLSSGFGCAHHSWLGCWAVCVLMCALRLHQATPGWGVRCGCVCSGSGFGCAPPLLAGLLGCVCACVRALLAPSHSWHGCAVWVCVFWLGFRLRPATPGWGVGVCVCWCGRSACTAPLLAGPGAVGVCVWTRVSAAPRHSWLGCCGVCALVCALRLYPATPGWGVRCGCVCLGSGFGSAPPLLAGVSGFVSACVRAPLASCHSWPGVCSVGVCASARVSAAPRHSWLGCWGVCVLLCALCLPPATPGTGGRCACVCLGSGFGCAPPLLAGVCVVGVCARARVLAAPRHSWLGCWGVCVLVCTLRLHPATPGTGARCGRVCLGSAFGCAPPLLAGLCVVGVCARARVLGARRHSWLGCWAVCSLVCALRLHPTTSGWGALCGCVCLGSGSGCARHSWLGCWAVCVLMRALRLHQATPGTGAPCGCVCLDSGFCCAPPLLAGVCVLGVCAQARILAAPRHSPLGCWGLCVLVWALRLHPATPGWAGRRGCVRSGSCFGCASPLLAGVL